MMKKFLSALACVLLVATTSSQGAAYTNYPASVGTGGGLPAVYSGQSYLLKTSWDWATQGHIATGDTIKMIYIPANTFVQGVGIAITTPAPTVSATVSIGDSSGAATWLAATSVTNATTLSYWSTPTLTGTAFNTNSLSFTWTPANGLGKLYTSADYILLTFSGAPTNINFTVKAAAYPMNP